MKLKVIITGTTGMVGEGVLIEALAHPDVEKILVINRKPCGYEHPKLTEIIHENFLDLSPVSDRLKDLNACFFCLGVSSLGMNRDKYFTVTYTLTLHMAEILARQNPEMTFCYVSGAGTDSTEKGRLSWARVKGRTENDLMKLPFKRAFGFRPAFLIPTPGMKNAYRSFKVIGPIVPLFKRIMPGYVSTLKELGLAMISSALTGYGKNIIEVADIKKLATTGNIR